jgi:hypothetical protein
MIPGDYELKRHSEVNHHPGNNDKKMLIGTFLMKEENSAYNCHLVTC